ncbi:MAG TPA: hypothetical protein VFI42_02280 [Thermomicrobiaceae bacterium]|nr:hypothetical protein [Thermomicrobiaceae bacterium]
MRVEFGKPVVSSDGKQIGRVERLVLGPDSELQALVMHHAGLHARNRIISPEQIGGTDDDGTIRLALTAQQAEGLPALMERQEITPTAAEHADVPYPLEGIGGGPIMWRSGPSGAGFHHYFEIRAAYDSAPVDAPTIQQQSSVGADSVVLGGGTDVMGSDGKKLGSLGGADFDAKGAVQRFFARIGAPLQHFNLELPSGSVAGGTHHRVRLGVPAERIERGLLTSDVLAPKRADA